MQISANFRCYKSLGHEELARPSSEFVRAEFFSTFCQPSEWRTPTAPTSRTRVRGFVQNEREVENLNLFRDSRRPLSGRILTPLLEQTEPKRKGWRSLLRPALILLRPEQHLSTCRFRSSIELLHQNRSGLILHLPQAHRDTGCSAAKNAVPKLATPSARVTLPDPVLQAESTTISECNFS